MITQSTYRDGNTELGKEMTPGINQSFEESENSQMSMTSLPGEMKIESPGGLETGGIMYHHQQVDQHPISDQMQYQDQHYYNQWCGGDYNQINYYQQGYGQQQQYQQYPYTHQYSREDMYSMGYRSDSPMGGGGYHPPARSPTGSNSTPSPHSQDIPGEDMTQLDLKRCPEETFRPSPVQPKKPKASRRKKKRDPNEPQKPVSAYALFFRDSQASIKGRNPNLTFGDVSKMVASLWDSLDSESKALYKKRTEMAKKEYLRQLASYRASLVSKGQAEDMFGFPGYGYPHMGVGQNIPPHPPSAPSQSINQVSPGGQGFHPSNEFNNQVGPGNDCSGSSPPCLSLPASSQGHSPHSIPVSSHQIPGHPAIPGHPGHPGHPAHMSSVAGQGYQDKYSEYSGPTGQFDGYHPVSQDRNHNQLGQPGVCGRPGCGRPVNKAADGTESTYCSSECVVGQCREVYSSWAGAGAPPTQQQPPTPQVK